MRNIKKIKIFALISGCLLIGCFRFAFSVSAQGAGITISPIRIEELVQPGEVLQKTIRVTNITEASDTFYFYLQDFKGGDEAGRPILVEPGTEDGSFLSSWVKTPLDGIIFGPGEIKEIPITIEVPANIGPGGYYGAVMLGTSPARARAKGEERGAAIAVGHQVGCLILLRVAGVVEEDAFVREFSTDRDFYPVPFEVRFLSRVENLGNIHIKPRGSIEIKDIFGRTSASIKVNEGGANVLPNSIRRFENEWKGNFGFGRFKAILILSFGVSVAEGGQGMQTLYATKVFWILPWKIIIPVSLATLFLIGLFIFFIKFYRDKAVRQALRKNGLGHIRYIRKYEGPSLILPLGLILLLLFLAVILISVLVYFLFFA